MLSKQNITIVLALMLLLALRIPITPHQVGWDSYFLHDVANSITESGELSNTENPLSLFGLYPYSYPIATSLVVGFLFLISKTNQEFIIWIFSTLLAVLSFFTMFKFSSLFTKDFKFKLLAALIYSTALNLVYLTSFTLSGRAFLISLMPLIFYLLFKKKSSKEIFLLVILLFLASLTHRMFIFVLLSVPPIIIINYLQNKYRFLGSENFGYISLFVLFSVLTIAPLLLFFDFKETYLSIISQIRQIGLGYFLFIAGIIFLCLKRERSEIENKLMLMSILSAPLLFFRNYGTIFILVYIPVVSIILIEEVLARARFQRALVSSFTVLIVMIALIFQIWHPGFLTGIDEYHERYITERELNIGRYVSQGDGKAVISTDEITMTRLSPFYPCYFMENNVPAVYCNQVKDVETTEIKLFSKELFESEEEFRYDIDSNLRWATDREPTAEQFYERYGIGFLLTTDGVYWSRQRLVNTIKEGRNSIFDNGKNKLWQIE